jgi:hypothetical protein
MLTRTKLLLIGTIILAITVVTNGFAAYLVAVSGLAAFLDTLSKLTHSLIYFQVAVLLWIIVDTDFPELIRKSQPLKRQVWLLWISQVFLGFVVILIEGNLLILPPSLIVSILCVLSLLSAFDLTRYYRTSRSNPSD